MASDTERKKRSTTKLGRVRAGEWRAALALRRAGGSTAECAKEAKVSVRTLLRWLERRADWREAWEGAASARILALDVILEACVLKAPKDPAYLQALKIAYHRAGIARRRATMEREFGPKVLVKVRSQVTEASISIDMTEAYVLFGECLKEVDERATRGWTDGVAVAVRQGPDPGPAVGSDDPVPPEPEPDDLLRRDGAAEE